MDQHGIVADGSPHGAGPVDVPARIAAAISRIAPATADTAVVLAGPRCRAADVPTAGTYVVALDGSIGDEGVIPVVAAWTVEFGGTPWLVDVVERWWRRPPDVLDSAYVNHRAGRLRRRIGCDVEHETLHGDRPARAIVEFAVDADASLIFFGTDADDRRSRRRRRSLATEIVRHATCPVVLLRLPAVQQAPRPPRKPVPPPPVWSRAWCEQYGREAVSLRRARPDRPPKSPR